MPRGGKRENAGRRKNEPESPASAPTKNLASKILAGLGKPNNHGDCKCEECLWKKDAEQPGADGSWARKYLWDRRDGKPVSTVNHVHDKPLQLDVTHTVSQRYLAALERAEKRVRDR